jgi:protein ImuA
MTAGADFAAAFGFGLAATAHLADGRPTLWVCDEAVGTETGFPYGAGAVEFGLDASAFLLARVRTEKQALQAALEGARCAGLGAVLLELNGASRGFDLTATRRLALACEASGTSLVVIRIGGEVRPSAVLARWRVSPAPSCALATRAPGPPTFLVRLERHRGGEPERVWRVEWDREATVLRSVELETALSGSVGAVSSGAGAAARRAAR